MSQERKRTSPGQRPNGFDHRPFRGLRTIVKDADEKPAAPRLSRHGRSPAPAAEFEESGESDTDGTKLFLREVTDVKPLAGSQRSRVDAPRPARIGRPPVSEAAEALAELADLVTGRAPFDVSDSDEYLEGMVKGLDRRIVRRLRRGEFARQAHLDLHGLTAEDARTEVEEFLRQAHRNGHRCVLIIHGRGLNSRDQIPILKNRLVAWLARGQCARHVLAFTSARLCDGGAGALYVLLRRDRASKKEIEVFNGSKS